MEDQPIFRSDIMRARTVSRRLLVRLEQDPDYRIRVQNDPIGTLMAEGIAEPLARDLALGDRLVSTDCTFTCWTTCWFTDWFLTAD